MYAIKAKPRWFLFIGIISSISLITLSLSEQSHAQVFNYHNDPDYQMYFDNDFKFTMDFPASWTVTDKPNSILFTGDGASLEVFAYNPTPGGWFPSLDTPIEQVANNLFKVSQNSPNLKLSYHSSMPLSNTPAYHLAYDENRQGDGPVLIDDYIVVSGDYLYLIKYTSPESLYDQNKAIRDIMINSIVLGDYYDDTNQQQNLAGYQKADAINGQAIDNFNTAAWHAGIVGDQMIADAAAADKAAKQKEIDDEYYESTDSYNDDLNDDVIDSSTGDIIDINK